MHGVIGCCTFQANLVSVSSSNISNVSSYRGINESDMACRSREELVGKRFMSVKSVGKLKIGKISDWEWRPGFIRAVSTRDTSNADLTVLVEFDDTGWKSREYIKVHEVFQEFLVEHTLSWVHRIDTNTTDSQCQWPSLCFKPIVDRASLFQHSKHRPVEFLGDRTLTIVDQSDIVYYKEGEENTNPAVRDCPEVIKLVKAWTDYQDGQKILLTTPTVLLGYRVEVYRTEGTTQWYTAVIKSYNHATKTLTLTDDTVLEEHNEDPALIQMHLIGDGVVNSILNGVDVGVAQRRRPRSTVTKQNSKDNSSVLTISRGISNVQPSSNPVTGTQIKQTSISDSHSTAAVITTSSRGTKLRSASVTDTPIPTSAASSSNKGQTQHKNQKQTSAKKKPDPAVKVSKKSNVVKRLSRSTSDDEDADSSSPASKQTCNVVVKRIEENSRKGKSDLPRLRKKPAKKKKPPDPKQNKCISNLENSLNVVNKLGDQINNKVDVSSVVNNKGHQIKAEVNTKEKGKAAAVQKDTVNKKATRGSAVNLMTLENAENQDNEIIESNRTAVTNSCIDNVLSSSKPNVAEKTNSPLQTSIKNEDSVKASEIKTVNVNKSTVDTTVCVNSIVVRESPQNKESKNIITIGGDKSELELKTCIRDDKTMLRDSELNSRLAQSIYTTTSQHVDLTNTFTDQLAKSKHVNTYSINDNGQSRSEVITTTNVLSAPIVSTVLQTDRNRSENNVLPKSHDFGEERQSAFTSVQSSISRINPRTPALDRSDLTRQTDSQKVSINLVDDKKLDAQPDDIRNVRSSPVTSPLIVDKRETVNPYRDPELMRKNPVHSNVHSIRTAQQHKMNQSPFTSVHAPLPGAPASSQSPAAYAGVSALPSRSLLGSLPSTLSFTNTHQLPPSLPHHLSLPHGYTMDAVVRAQQHQLAALQQQHILGYTLNSSPAMSTLEALWQRKFPSAPFPSHYMLQKSADTLLPADIATAIHREQIQLQIDHERREIERIEVERRERERLEKELREKEHKEILERERQEKEKAERERQEWEHKQNQERILRESAVDTEAAVEKHFAESLTRLASQQGITMFPSITHGTGRGPKTEGVHSLPPSHGLPFHEKKHFEHKGEEHIKREMGLPDDKQYINKSLNDKSSAFTNYPYGSSSYHPISQQNQQAIFNLYGYPSSHSTITPEQLKQRGLNTEPKHIKEEIPDKKTSFSSPHIHTSSPVHLGQISAKEIKQELHNSVIVKREIKPVPKIENLVAAHSHHTSPSSSSPRPQHPRPAHTPEHRPLSSSSSPALSAHLHHHPHRSSPIAAGSTYPPSCHGIVFSSTDIHVAPRPHSPYTPAASQSQHQPLNFCKSSSDIKKTIEQQPPPPQMHTSYSSIQAPVSVPNNSLAYSYSLIQQGLVPNPMYSQGVSSHKDSIESCSIGGSVSNSVIDSKPPQVSPGGKRKIGSKDNVFNRKKVKGQTELSINSHIISIPVTTPQIITNSSPYTTASSNSMMTRPDIGSVKSSPPASTNAGVAQISTGGFMDSFKSFVENAVHSVYFQDEKRAPEKAEKEQVTVNLSGSSNKFEINSHQRHSTSDIQSQSNGSEMVDTLSAKQDMLLPGYDSYSSRIMETINRVANNQADTDSDTLSAPSPPPQIKHSDTNSPASKSVNSSSSSHLPHNMKKAWLQRHDEDKKSETPIFLQGEDDSNCSLNQARDIICCVENPSASAANGCQEGMTASPANVVVTLPNGNVSDGKLDESTSSASESETKNSSKNGAAKKRSKINRSSEGSSKKAKSDIDTPVSTPPTPVAFNSSISQNKPNSKLVKTDDNKSKDESMDITNEQLYSSTSHPQSCEQTPALSESNPANTSFTSSTNSTTHSKASSNTGLDKKKQPKRNRETTKDGKKSSSFSKPLVKMSVATLKKTLMPFIQDGPCSEITPKLNKCRECKMTPGQRCKKIPNIFCRFYAFRRLKYNSRGIVTIDGFSELSDADPDDIEPWLPRFPVQDPDLDVENSKFIVAKVGDKFCELVEQEKEAKTWAGENLKIVWKRAVMGVREMCDVCDTTLFNMHWVCQKCGFVVCLDCYKVRVRESKKEITDDKWLTCSSNKQFHKASELMLTQIIPSDALWELGRLIHDIRAKWSIQSNCPCGGSSIENKVIPRNGINQLLNAVTTRKVPNGLGSEEFGSKNSQSKKQESNPLNNLDTYNPDTTSSPLSILAEVASMEPNSDRDKSDAKKKMDSTVAQGSDSTEETDKKSSCSTLRELLTKTAGKPKVTNDKKLKKGSGLSTLDDIIQSVVEKSCSDGGAPFKFLHYTPRLGGWKRELPIMIHNLTETSVLYPDVPHSWLCDGRLLHLHDGHHKGNQQIFQEQWKRGQPVIVSCANKKMNLNLWKPDSFIKEFGHIENEVVNCRTGDVIIGHTMGEFWEGFENLKNRPIDSHKAPMLLKLKDWPPGDDFSELLPARFQDLMSSLPLPEYTHRNGKLNLASRLPDFLVRPDLGPKMYNAYGSSQFSKEGTTNLHLDISDAVNVMVYVGIPDDGPGGRKAQEEAAIKAIDDAGCDSITKRRVREVHEVSGALWHIYDAHDADKIRDFLNKVAKERGEIIETDHDAIHDQSWYLDKELCDRLLKEYGVQGYTIVQCLGDAIFIPAGAPHQVRNLHSCVKVAEDFVSPEHLNHCFRLTQEFRQLSKTHSNHEDKLQVKNIIYHAVKDAIAVLRENKPENE